MLEKVDWWEEMLCPSNPNLIFSSSLKAKICPPLTRAALPDNMTFLWEFSLVGIFRFLL